MSEMDDYQLVRIGLLAAISDRAAELGTEIADEAADTIVSLRAQVVALEGLLREVGEPYEYHDETSCCVFCGENRFENGVGRVNDHAPDCLTRRIDAALSAATPPDARREEDA